MSKIVSLSEAASIGIHSVIIVAKSAEAVNVIKIAELTGTSKHHVAKVMQRLVKEGFVKSQRGPTGGFRLNLKAENINFLEVYEAIEGRIEVQKCPMNKTVCPFDKCILNNVMSNMTVQFRDYLKEQRVADYLDES